MSDSRTKTDWHNRLLRYPNGQVQDFPLHGDMTKIDAWVPKFRGGVVPMSFVAAVTGKDVRTIRRWAVQGKIPGCRRHKRRKTMRGHCHFVIRNDSIKFWEWMEEQAHAREGAKIWREASGRRRYEEKLVYFIALNEHCDPVKAMDLAHERYGIMLERLPSHIKSKLAKQSEHRCAIAYFIAQWDAEGTLPTSGQEAGRRLWGKLWDEDFRESERRKHQVDCLWC